MKTTFRLNGLGCANCAAKMEKAINKIEGVKEATVNFITTKLTIEGDEDKMDTIVAEADKIVRKIEPGTVMKKA